MAKRRYQSSMERDLALVRIWFKPERMLPFDGIQFWSVRMLGTVWRLLPVLASSMKQGWTLRQMANIARVSHATLKNDWETICVIFEECEPNQWRLRDDVPWLQVQRITVRPNVRQFIDKLIEFWGAACVYCGTAEGELQIDHIMPKSRGGSDELTNLTLACRRCNVKKHARTAEEFGYPHIHEQAARIQ